MKKILFPTICVCFIFLQTKVAAQNSSINLDSVQMLPVRTANDLKTGNWQDVLTNFFQLGLNDLTSSNKSFSFKSSLFALKLKTDPSLVVDTQYVKHSFDRNFQFNFSLGIDSSYKLNGYSAGFTWAAINKRDTTLINLTKSKTDSAWASAYNTLNRAIISYRTRKWALRTSQDSADAATVKTLVDNMMSAGNFNPNAFPSDFMSDLNASNSMQALNGVYTAFTDAKAATQQKALLTFSFNTAFTKRSTFDSAQLGVIFLQGLTKKGNPLELDIRANLVVKDTAINNDRYRTVFTSSGGMNCVLIKNKAQASILEFKPYVEYNKTFSGLFPGEKAEYFYANADLRLRVTKNIWVPITIKYDVKAGSFLGFLNVSANFSALRGLLKY